MMEMHSFLKAKATEIPSPDDEENVSACDLFGFLFRNFKQFFDLTLCNSANGGKACVYRLSRHLLYGKTTRI